MTLKTLSKKQKLAIMAFLLVILYSVSISTLFIAMLLGLLFIPPLLLFASVFIEGVVVILKGLNALVESGKERFVISISKDSIVLEPHINR